MAKKNQLLAAPPYPVEQTLKQWGANLRTARLRRNLTIKEVAQKIGTGPRPIAAAERGNPSTGVVVYVALLWVLDLLDQMANVADPAKDKEGQMFAVSREPSRAGHRGETDNDF